MMERKNKNELIEKQFARHLFSCIEDMHILLQLMEQHKVFFQRLRGESAKLQAQGKLLECCDILVKICSEF